MLKIILIIINNNKINMIFKKCKILNKIQINNNNEILL